MSNKPILKYAQFRPILSHFPLSTGQIFKLISPHENNIKIFQLKYISILHIKRQQKITQAKVFENFTSRQHALMFMYHIGNICTICINVPYMVYGHRFHELRHELQLFKEIQTCSFNCTHDMPQLLVQSNLDT